jgi:multiple sugar transport system permease protein
MTSGSIIAIIPMIIFALMAQKHIVKGLTLGSVKG